MTKKKVLMIVGSMRKNSFNRQLAAEIKAILGDRVEIGDLAYDDVPFINQDTEYPAPEAVARVRKAVTEADGLWLVTPEYNFSYPGILKNVIDWLSRPLVKNDYQTPSTAHGKKVTISGAAGKSAAGNSRKKLAELLQFIGMELCGGEGTGIALPGESFMTDKLIMTDENREALKHQADEFIKFLG